MENLHDLSEEFNTTKEKVVSPEQFEENLKRFEENIVEIDRIPESVIQSGEGKEATQSFLEKVTDKLVCFKQNIANKLASLESWKNKERMTKVLGGIAGATILAPALIQIARYHWPEVGNAIDAAPHALQQLVHLDIFSSVADALTHDDLGSMWRNGSIEVNNLLADISSGRQPFSSLQPEQLQILKDGMDPSDFAILSSPGIKDTASWANTVGSPIAGVRMFVNSGIIAPTMFGIGTILSKVGKMAKTYQTRHLT